MDSPRTKDRWKETTDVEAATRPTSTRDQANFSDGWSRNHDAPVAIDPDEIGTYRSIPDGDFESSPDVALDGSIKTEEPTEPAEVETDVGMSIPWWAVVGVTLLCGYGAFAYFVL